MMQKKDFCMMFDLVCIFLKSLFDLHLSTTLCRHGIVTSLNNHNDVYCRALQETSFFNYLKKIM